MAAAQEADGAGSAVVAAGGGSSGQVRRPRGARGGSSPAGGTPAGSVLSFLEESGAPGAPCPRGTLNLGPWRRPAAQEAERWREPDPVARQVSLQARAGRPADSLLQLRRGWRGGAQTCKPLDCMVPGSSAVPREVWCSGSAPQCLR